MIKEGRGKSSRGKSVLRLDMFCSSKKDNFFFIRSHILNECPSTRGSLKELNIFKGQRSDDRNRLSFTYLMLKGDTKVFRHKSQQGRLDPCGEGGRLANSAKYQFFISI